MKAKKTPEAFMDKKYKTKSACFFFAKGYILWGTFFIFLLLIGNRIKSIKKNAKLRRQ